MRDDAKRTARPDEANAQVAAQRTRRRRCPSVVLWGLCTLCVALIVLMQSGVLGLEYRHDVTNVLSLVVAALAGLTGILWFVFFSGYPTPVRYGTAIGITAALATTTAAVRIEQVSGDLMPKLTFRWQSDPDWALEPPNATGGEVDVATTTEYDFPQFLGPRRNALVSGVSLDSDWERHRPELLWQRRIGAGWSAFAAVHGFAVTMEQRGEQELVTCYEVSSGRLRWSHAVTARHQTVFGGAGPRATPTIADGRVYALGATGVLRCLDGATGQAIWSDDLLARVGLTPEQDLDGVAWGRSASPLVVDDLVVVPLGGPLDGPWVSLIAFDKQTGQVRWTGGDHQVAYASPSLATLGGQRQILIVSQDYVSGHRPETGEPLWQHPWPGKSNANANVSQAVPLSGNRVLLTKGYGGGAELLRVTPDQNRRWQVSVLWTNRKVLNTKFTNVVVADDAIYGLSDGILHCAELATGRRLWRGGRYGQGQILGVGDSLLVLAESGQLALVDLSKRNYNELYLLDALEGKTWNNLCLYGRYLLVRNSEMAACYELRLADGR